ncbi:MAG: TolC family protein [Fusobacteriaceae bacterium]
MKRIFYIFFLVLFLSFTLYGKTIKLSFDEALSRAYNYDYDYKNAQLDIENSKQAVSSSFKAMLPSLDYTGNINSAESTTGSGRNDTTYTHVFSVKQPLFQGGALLASWNIAKTTNLQSDFRLADSKIKTYMSTLDKYTALLTAINQRNVYEASLKAITEQYNQTNRKYQLNLIAKTDVLPIQTRVINIQTLLMKSENLIITSKADLKNYLGIGSSDDVELDDINANNYDLNKIQLEKDVKYARINNRNVRIAELELKKSESQKVIARSEMMPSIAATASQRGVGPDFSKSTENFNTTVGISASMKLFQFGKNYNDYKISSNNVAKAENSSEKARNDIELMVRNGYVDLLTYKGMVDQQKAAVAAAQESYNAVSKRFSIGLTDVVDLLTVQETLVTAQLNLIIANYNYYRAFAYYESLLR